MPVINKQEISEVLHKIDVSDNEVINGVRELDDVLDSGLKGIKIYAEKICHNREIFTN